MENVWLFTTLSQRVALNVFSLPIIPSDLTGTSAGLRLNNRLLLDTPPVVTRGTDEYFTHFGRVEIYRLNLIIYRDFNNDWKHYTGTTSSSVKNKLDFLNNSEYRNKKKANDVLKKHPHPPLKTARFYH